MNDPSIDREKRQFLNMLARDGLRYQQRHPPRPSHRSRWCQDCGYDYTPGNESCNDHDPRHCKLKEAR